MVSRCTVKKALKIRDDNGIFLLPDMVHGKKLRQGLVGNIVIYIVHAYQCR